LATVAIAASVCLGQWHERQKVYALGAGPDDWFGASVSIDDARMAVGSPQARRAAHVFSQSTGWWLETATLDSNDSGFGTAVDVAGDLVVVGAPNAAQTGLVRVFELIAGQWTETASIWGIPDALGLGLSVTASDTYFVSGAPFTSVNGYPHAGVAYAFAREAGSWTLVAGLSASNPFASSYHGDASDTDGRWVVVGAWNGWGYREGTGSAHVYDPTDWTASPALLAADDGQSGDWFGKSVAISGSVALVGAPFDDDKGNASGSVYVYRRIADQWFQHQKLSAPDAQADDFFGFAVAIHESRAVIGAYGANDAGDASGKAYYFEDTGLEWLHVSTLRASDAQANDKFGSAVAIDDDTLAVGAYADGDKGNAAGAVYVFSPFCPADWNADGSTNSIDVIAFLNDWTRRRSHCDLNRDGAVNTQDFLAFLNAWTAGC